MTRNRKLLFAAAAGLVLFICGCSLLLALFAPSSAPPVQPAAALPTSTAAPIPTPVPSPLPSPTPPPPTPLPLPTDTPAPPPASLGITQASLKTVYEDFGFTFADAAPVAGQPRIMGESSTAYIELIGPPDNLTQVSLMFAATQDQAKNTVNIVYLVSLLNGAVSGWAGGVDWLTSALSQTTTTGQPVSTTYQNKSIELTAHKELGLIILTIKGTAETSSQAPVRLLPTAAPIPPQPGDCDCSANLYNCEDFASSDEARACFDYCNAIGAGDIHELDRDADNVICELR